MTTKFIGVKELRQNLSKVTKRAEKNKERLIVLRNNEPIFELRPIPKKNRVIEKLLLDIDKARQDVKKGDVYTLEQVEKMLDL